MREIPLTQGKVALVDDADYEQLVKYRWYALKSYHTYYAVRNGSRTLGKQSLILMHRVIMRALPGQETDHVDGNGLNNRHENLRLCTTAENQHNQRKHRGSSRFKGVWRHTNRQAWEAGIGIDCKKLYLGYFHNEDDAAKAYDRAARELFGEFACLNFPTTEGSLT